MNILLSSIGRRSWLALYFRQAMRGVGKVIGTNSRPHTPGLLAVDIPEIVPPCYDRRFIPTMLEVCRRYEVKILLSNHDLEIAYLAPHRDAFLEIGTFPVVPDRDIVQVCRSKMATTEFGAQHDIAVPATYGRLDDARQAVAEGREMYPLVVKPRHGFGSIGLEIVHSDEELEAAYHLTRAKTARTVIARDPDYKARESVVIQHKIDGPEYGIDVVNDLQGSFAACLVERKLAMVGGSTDAVVIEDQQDLIRLGKKVGSLTRHPGNMDVDVIVQDGVPYLLEMNPRFGGHYPFAHAAGANVPAALVAWARNETPPSSWLRASVGCLAMRDLTYFAAEHSKIGREGPELLEFASQAIR